MTTTLAGRPVSGETPPQSGMVRLVAENGRRLTLIRNGAVDRGGGVGGWQQSERMLREDADWWKGTPKDTLSIPCLLDIDAVGGPSLERRLQVLYAMGAATDDDDPPAIRLTGEVPASAKQRWKLDDIKLGAALYREDAPQALRRIEVTLELSTLATSSGVDRVSVRRTRDRGGKRRRRTVHARKNDTLRAIAVRELGSSGAYKQIREWNAKFKHTDPDARLRAGIKVVLR